MYKKLTSDEALKLYKSEEDFILLDVRTESEHKEIKIPKSVLLTKAYIQDEHEEILPDKDKKILVYCHSGVRSRQAVNELLELGYTNVYDIGGILEWKGETTK